MTSCPLLSFFLVHFKNPSFKNVSFNFFICVFLLSLSPYPSLGGNNFFFF